MKQNASPTSHKLIWALCALLAIVGIGLSLHALINLDRTQVTVEWSTASELDTVGFNLLRSEDPAGPFQQVNAQLIPAASDTLSGSKYRYEDSEAVAGITYYYMLEEIESTGNANQHGPIVVTASSPMRIQLLVGGLLLASAVIYTIVLLRDPQKRNASAHE